MLNRYPLWKYILILGVLLISAVYALPNLYGEDPAVQISAQRGAVIDEATKNRLLEALDKRGVKPFATTIDARSLLFRFNNTDEQIAAQDVIRTELGPQYTVALNLASSTPAWLEAIGARPMYLGLDLRGGVHFLLQVDMPAALRQADERYVSDFRTLMREEKLRYKRLARAEGGGVEILFRDAETRDQAYDLLRGRYPELSVETIEKDGAAGLHTALTEKAVREVRTTALEQNITTLRNRVNELGVAEPVIQQQGDDRIVVQLPGVQDTARAKELLGATATLEFRLVDQTGSVQDALAGRVPPTARLYRDRDGNPILLERTVMLTGDYITDASSGIDQQSGSPAVYISLDGKGARLFAQRTGDKIGRAMATVFIENKVETSIVDGKEVRTKRTVEEVINVATIRDQLGARFQITGLDSTEEARDLALLRRAGALAAPVEIVEERTVGPSLGRDNINQGFLSVVVGFVGVMIFMVAYYRGFGMFANLALAFNLVIVVALLSMLQATLTLPGIAGIVLTIGMAVDANVLINERIREELRNGNTPQASIHAGYEKAFGTIADANITTLIAAVVLFGLGTGPVKGFAVTLSLGILTSMFTAIMGTRAVANLVYGGRRVSALSI